MQKVKLQSLKGREGKGSKTPLGAKLQSFGSESEFLNHHLHQVCDEGILCVTLNGKMVAMRFCGGCY